MTTMKCGDVRFPRKLDVPVIKGNVRRHGQESFLPCIPNQHKSTQEKLPQAKVPQG